MPKGATFLAVVVVEWRAAKENKVGPSESRSKNVEFVHEPEERQTIERVDEPIDSYLESVDTNRQMLTGDEESLPINDVEPSLVEKEHGAIMVLSENEVELPDTPEDQVARIANGEQSPKGPNFKRKRVEGDPPAIRMYKVSC